MKEILPSSLLGNYLTSAQVLGKGTSAEVRLGTHPETRNRVALKVSTSNASSKKSSSDRGVLGLLQGVSSEVNILNKLLHFPNTSQLIDVFTTDKEVVQVMEFIEGQNLLQFFIEGKQNMTEDEARSVVFELGSIIRRLHEQKNVAHLDIKLENVMIDRINKRMVLVDFGFAQEFDPKHPKCLSSRKGSPQYCAPEIYYNTPLYDGRLADVYSLGVALYVLVLGKFPFEARLEGGAENVPAIFQRKRNMLFLPCSDGISSSLSQLFKEVFQPDPSRRISLDQFLKHEWFTSPSSSSSSTNAHR